MDVIHRPWGTTRTRRKTILCHESSVKTTFVLNLVGCLKISSSGEGSYFQLSEDMYRKLLKHGQKSNPGISDSWQPNQRAKSWVNMYNKQKLFGGGWIVMWRGKITIQNAWLDQLLYELWLMILLTYSYLQDDIVFGCVIYEDQSTPVSLTSSVCGRAGKGLSYQDVAGRSVRSVAWSWNKVNSC